MTEIIVSRWRLYTKQDLHVIVAAHRVMMELVLGKSSQELN